MARPILYLNFTEAPKSRMPRLKLDGIRRFARLLKCPVESHQGDDVRPDKLAGILDRFRPLGCIAECWYDQRALPPRLFGDIPVVYFDAPRGREWRGAASVSCDEKAVARIAFRELSASRPPSFAVVSYWLPRLWADRRIAAFRALCRQEGVECRVFPTVPGEDRKPYAARLAQWVASLPPRCAVFAVNDESSVFAARALAAAGRHVPKTATLLGVDALTPPDDNPDIPGISSVEVDFELAGYLAAKLLATKLAPQAPPSLATPATIPAFGPLLVVRRKSTSGTGRHERFILDAVEIIRREACAGLTVADLAARFKCSRRLFDMRFREATGHSARDEIEHVRFENAFTLLKSTDKPISAIADFCGYRTDSALRHIFLARTGMSMREWRARNRR